MQLGRGTFSRVIVDENEPSKAVKIIEMDDQKPPHRWKSELDSLRASKDCTHVVDLLAVSESNSAFDRELRSIMPRYDLTLEQSIFAKSKANWPAGSGWRNVMTPTMIKHVLVGIAQALEAAASKGIIHRDIKPDNVMFMNIENEDELIESLVSIDFGISFVPWNIPQFETADHKVCDVSTGEYKAPEVLYGVSNYDEKIDIWSSGCIIARLLSTDSKPLFTPYTSDIGLISAQFELLGRPVLSECPSLRDSAVQNMAADGNQTSHFTLKRLSSDALMQKLFDSTQRMLDYEPTKRPSAAEILKELNSMKCN